MTTDGDGWRVYRRWRDLFDFANSTVLPLGAMSVREDGFETDSAGLQRLAETGGAFGFPFPVHTLSEMTPWPRHRRPCGARSRSCGHFGAVRRQEISSPKARWKSERLCCVDRHRV